MSHRLFTEHDRVTVNDPKLPVHGDSGVVIDYSFGMSGAAVYHVRLDSGGRDVFLAAQLARDEDC